MKPLPKIIAEFCPQAWQNGYAISVDAEGEFIFNNMTEDEARAIEDDEYSSDALRTLDSAPEWVRNWQGPFYVRVQDSIAAFWDAFNAD
jgi:hypothetical protein